MEHGYKTLISAPVGEYKEKGSKFLAYAAHVQSEEDIKEFLEQVRKEHPKSRHLCYAYILGDQKETQFANDDGEPSGTAGKPILNQILSADLSYCCVGVIRYFGGTKLGASGLVRAYKSAAENALNQAKIKNLEICQLFSLKFDYEVNGVVNGLVNKYNAQIVEQAFEMDCFYLLALEQNLASKFEEELVLLNSLKFKKEGLQAI